MRLSILLIACAASFASASEDTPSRRQLSNLPACAIPCLTSTTTMTFGNCSETDEACLCANSQFISTTTSCITGACTGSDLQNALQASESLCESVGVPLNVSSIIASVLATASTSISISISTGAQSTTVTPTSNDAALSNNVKAFSALLGLWAGVIASLAL